MTHVRSSINLKIGVIKVENLLGLLAFIAISSSYSICKGSKYEGQQNFQENYDTAFILDDDTLVEEIYEHAPLETKAKILMLRPRLIEGHAHRFL